MLHDCKTEISRGEIKRLLKSFGYGLIKRLVDVKLGDALSHASPYAEIRVVLINDFSKKVDEIENNGECYKLKQLKINGNDVKSFGFKGEEISEVLNKILLDVTFDKIPNEREVLLDRLNYERSIRK